MNRYLIGAYALGASPAIGTQETFEMMESPIFASDWREDPVQLGAAADDMAAAAAWQAQQKKLAAAVPEPPRESGISIAGVALLVGVILVGLATWPRVSRWLG